MPLLTSQLGFVKRITTTFRSKTSLAVPLLVGALALFGKAWATDPPHLDHDDYCSNCHKMHHASGAPLMSVAGGEPNLCQSCHIPGGHASATALFNSDQAVPWPGVPPGVPPSGTSHRWDSGAAGRIVHLGGAATPSSGVILPSGAYTGPYAKTYTITISTGGQVGSAQFSWTATTPGGGSAANVLTGTNVPLDQGVTLSFFGASNATFQLNDRWQLYVRSDLRSPTNSELAVHMLNGQMKCSTCHDAHSQEHTPFDPAAPVYAGAESGAGRHYQRADNNTDQMCLDCHASRNVTNSVAGSHPVNIAIATNANYWLPTSLPLDKNSNRVFCSTCHEVHNAAGNDGNLLRLTNHTTLCVQCHTSANLATPARHLNPTNTLMRWPGGQYGSAFPAITNVAMSGQCDNCHQAHGWPNATNTASSYPTLLVEREENLCFTCHDGSPGSDNLKSVFTKTYSHPVITYNARHTTREDGIPSAYGSTNRHSECVDCHNPHALTSNATPPVAPLASGRLSGVSRVSVTNVAVNNVRYTWRGPKDSTPVREYELCFLCHSAWTTQPSGQGNAALEFNSMNPSFHPVEAIGKNTTISNAAFVNGWTASKLTYCTDCHTSDNTAVRGPHASTNRYILKKPYSASRTVTETSSAICFDCHNYNTYTSTTTSVKASTRWRGAGSYKKHIHASKSCFGCHDSHGSTTYGSLIAVGTGRDLVSYTRTANGGSCSAVSGCHGSESYTVGYPR